MLLTICLILALILLLATVTFYFWGSKSLLPPEKLSEIIEYAKTNLDSKEKTQTVFTVMTCNIGYLSGMSNNRPVREKKTFFNSNMESFIQTLNEVKPDFIGFQEIDFHSNRSYFVDQLKEIAEKGNFQYGAKAVNWDKRYVPFPFGLPSVHFGEIQSGQAVLSRYPILSSDRIAFEKPSNNFSIYNAFYLDRLAQVVKIRIGIQPIVIINIHLEAFNTKTRECQAMEVLKIYHSYCENYPVLIIGDFNSVPPDAYAKKDFVDEPETDYSKDSTLSYFLNEKTLNLAEREYLTFPADHPTRKLDYVFYNHEKIKLEKVFTLSSRSSDHFPLVMRFTFKEESK